MSGSDDAAAAEAGSRAQEMYREKPTSTVVRVLTVMAYLSSVSFAAVLLSVYYICIWKSPVLPKLGDENKLLAETRQGHPGHYGVYPDNVLNNLTGRSDTTVNDNSTETTIENLNNFTSTEAVETTDVPQEMEAITTDTSETDNLTDSTLDVATGT